MSCEIVSPNALSSRIQEWSAEPERNRRYLPYAEVEKLSTCEVLIDSALRYGISRVYLWDEAFLSSDEWVDELGELIAALGFDGKLGQGDDILIVVTGSLGEADTQLLRKLVASNFRLGWLLGIWGADGELAFSFDHHDMMCLRD